MREFPGIQMHDDDDIRVVTLNRPDELNSFTEDFHATFVELWRHLADIDDTRAIVLTGAGRIFSAGGSFDDFERRRSNPEVRRRSMRNARALIDAMLQIEVPIVAAVNGPAVGLGATVATLCDIVFMADTAFLADTHVSVALVAGDGGAVTWPAHVGLLRAKQYLLSGDRLAAHHAVEMGLANFVVPGESVVAEACAYAHRLAAQPAQATRATKAILNQHLRANAVRVLDYGLAVESASHDTDDYAAAIERLRPT